ncbi:MAG: COG1615 family transporter, partial [Scytonema sp. RU_4_4]|nr:COG1615 family transporter [Scytonema sp. RU_4_4]
FLSPLGCKYPQDGQGDKGTRGLGDKGTRGQGDKGTRGNFDFPLRTQDSGLGLRLLLPVVIVLSALAGLILIYYGQQALILWRPNIQLLSTTLPLTPWLQQVLQQVQMQQITIPIVQSILLLVLTIAIIIHHEFCLRAIALLICLLLGFLLSARWDKVLQYFHATSFHRTEPLFQRDISFYVFSLPIWELLAFWLVGLFLFNIAAVTLIYLRSANSLSEGRFTGFSTPQRLHLNALSSLFMLAVALHYCLARYELLYSTRGVIYGASYTDVMVLLPIYTGLSVLAVAIAIYLLLRMIVLSRTRKTNFKPVLYPPQLIYALGLYIFVAAISGEILPSVVQRLVVQPNELTRERPYIERTIALTRKAFNLNAIEARTFDPRGQLTATDLQENDLTIRNIRLWDTRPLLKSNRQLQQIRPYYKFPGADIDRYTLKRDQRTEKQQTIIAARELDFGDVPAQAQTWINKRLIYTHGYGFTLSPVNVVAPGGLPDYYVKDIGVNDTDNQASLLISNESVLASIPIAQPRIYYGEITNTYVMTGTKTKELDYPSGYDNVYNVYDGRGGISIGAMWRRLVFAEYLKDWQMLLTRNFTPQTKLLYRRNIKERVQAIAPFLRYDGDPYLVAADGEGTDTKGEKTYLYWMIDAYTTSDRYPYSDPGNNGFNYIRNSVKVVIDAYNGSVNFYIADPTDPIIHTLMDLFPKLLKPLDEMPVALRSHIRYPQDFFSIQSERLLTYHMTDPQVFYNREDLWQIPDEIYGSKQQQVEPYYLIMKLPQAQSEEFILLLPFKPVQRANLIAWLAARSDEQEYGKMLLYEFPKQQLVYGTEQIEALINQDPVISQQISLWSRQGSRAIQGNLLVIPIERSLLYVEPLYLEAEQNSLPTLVRVIVAYNHRIVMAETLEQALAAIFQENQPTTPPIVRPVQ